MNRCLATLADLPREGITAAAQHRLAGGRQNFPARVGITRKQAIQWRTDHVRDVMSISGMQDKISVRLLRGVLEPVATGGTHILKPQPPEGSLPEAAEVPANEHLTMLIASTVADIQTAACSLVRLADDELAYITRRFDRLTDGSKLRQEDLAAATGRSPDGGHLWKYDASYEEIARTIRTFSQTVDLDLQELFRRVLFCYLIGNGDAHLRNFSFLTEPDGLTRLAPAYDLLCTRLHIAEDMDLAMPLLEREREGAASEAESLRQYGAAEFQAFGAAIGLSPRWIAKTMGGLTDARCQERIAGLVVRSFLRPAAQAHYLDVVESRLSRLRPVVGR